MGEHGAALQKYNQELVKCIEQLKIKREEYLLEINDAEQVKHSIEKDLHKLHTEVDKLSSKISKKRNLLDNCDKAIKEAEAAFMKILESSQVLLSKVLKESEEIIIKEENQE